MFKLQIAINISDYENGRDFLDVKQILALQKIMGNRDSSFDCVTVTIDTDHNPKIEKLPPDNEII